MKLLLPFISARTHLPNLTTAILQLVCNCSSTFFRLELTLMESFNPSNNFVIVVYVSESIFRDEYNFLHRIIQEFWRRSCSFMKSSFVTQVSVISSNPSRSQGMETQNSPNVSKNLGHIPLMFSRYNTLCAPCSFFATRMNICIVSTNLLRENAVVDASNISLNFLVRDSIDPLRISLFNQSYTDFSRMEKAAETSSEANGPTQKGWARFNL
mmetsp:Transcript_3435/g.6587  ORF Transcript_3435/g.6587 Transcript_3435/m.6587 type:complete len:212 (-) Transcript_3435:2565-3200(-)